MYRFPKVFDLSRGYCPHQWNKLIASDNVNYYTKSTARGPLLHFKGGRDYLFLMTVCKICCVGKKRFFLKIADEYGKGWHQASQTDLLQAGHPCMIYSREDDKRYWTSLDQDVWTKDLLCKEAITSYCHQGLPVHAAGHMMWSSPDYTTSGKWYSSAMIAAHPSRAKTTAWLCQTMGQMKDPGIVHPESSFPMAWLSRYHPWSIFFPLCISRSWHLFPPSFLPSYIEDGAINPTIKKPMNM